MVSFFNGLKNYGKKNQLQNLNAVFIFLSMQKNILWRKGSESVNWKQFNVVFRSRQNPIRVNKNKNMKYGYTIIYVEDVGETIEFYEKAFGFQRKFITPENDYGELLSGATTIAFATLALGHSNFKKGFEPLSNNGKPMGIELAFVTEDIDKDFQKAKAAGAVVYERIVEKPWGQKVGYLRDNNGLLIEVCTPIKN